MELKIPTKKEVEEIDGEIRHCEKCNISESKESISYVTGLCDTCFRKNYEM